MQYSVHFSLALSSVDRAGVLFYPELFRHAHDAYEAFMAHLGWKLADLLAEGGLHIPIVHAEADYLVPMHHGEEISVDVTLGRVGDSSFSVDCEFSDAQGTQTAKVRSIHVCVDAESGRPTEIPADLLQKLEPYISGVGC